MNKFSARSLPSVSRDNSTFEESSTTPDWLNSFVDNLEKNSVKSQRSIYDEISAIINNTKSKYSSVEEAVDDMRERTGLKSFLQSQASTSIQEPEIFKTSPEMKVFIDNFIADHPGTSIESVIHDLLKIDTIKHKLSDTADVGDDVKKYINDKLAEVSERKFDANQTNLNLGKVDRSNAVDSDDPLAICEPTGLKY